MLYQKDYLDFNLIEHLSIVHTNNRPNHFRNNDHITEMGLDNLRLLMFTGLHLGLAQLLQERHRTVLHSTLEATTGTGVEEFNEL